MNKCIGCVHFPACNGWIQAIRSVFPTFQFIFNGCEHYYGGCDDCTKSETCNNKECGFCKNWQEKLVKELNKDENSKEMGNV